MKKKQRTVLILLSPFLIAFAFEGLGDQGQVPYPSGYRSWTHVKSKVSVPKDPADKSSSTYHHIYANDLAMQGYRIGKYPKGSVIVADFIAAVDSGAALLEGQRKYIDVMVRDTELYASTGGWGFEEFEKDSRTTRRVNIVNAQACFNCHRAQADSEFVFSKYRD